VTKDGAKRRPGLFFAVRLLPLALLSHKRKDIALLGEWGKNEYFFWGNEKTKQLKMVMHIIVTRRISPIL
jgi:hypothetical protein